MQASAATRTDVEEHDPVPTRPRASLLRRIGRNRTLLLMCLPAIAFFVVFSYAPMPGAWIAFTNFNYRDGIFGSPFVGLRNFEFLVQSGQLWLLTRNTVLYNLAFIVLGNILQIALAIMLNEIRAKYFKKISQAVMFLPYFISVVLIGVIAFNLLNYDTGYVNALIQQTGGDPIKIYSIAGAWPIIIVLFQLWQSTGYGSIVYFAAIMGIDNSLFEAAAIDGASAWQRIRYIILPSLKPTFIILLLFSLGGIMNGNFGLFWNLIGNNAALFSTTDIIETSVYRMILSQNNFTSSTAVGLYQSLFGFALVLLANWIVRRINEDYALF
ncbi:ABC transporter permease [Myceligenerans pegani]|uniref:Sugar ABC transporter permease n=1 Tax=Myceligenerans pegani TaxID=2776917 RepID=A0ABR9MZ71_9MICO|nr:ABC transporter permease subunit [Myceligenerans sp. TRM 65318]MBE1876082.1 sugar ABC transporter permease [Myceligenerans sp. TRM 65318]MBE3018353.1 sugar ABC transporter permease [Myceligenerans sp. TRM 65318]